MRDTIFCFSKDVIIEYPLFNKITVDNYEEGFFRIINCPLDSAAIVIHCGAMVNLPLTDTTKVTISSKFILDKDIRILRGYDMQESVKRYFREDNYFRYGLTVMYMNVGETEQEYYEHFLNDM